METDLLDTRIDNTNAHRHIDFLIETWINETNHQCPYPYIGRIIEYILDYCVCYNEYPKIDQIFEFSKRL